ncbi:MAG: UvrD-helicase domain-containing protein, partial [Candidatus Staskawiczbacteria bacterium]|nr:UvrD-helicase domain-containing protein [Candidatus Staskawiczbacteria bacterium]
PLVGTFHSICARILRKEIEVLGYNKNFAIYDEGDQLVLVKKTMKDMEIDEKKINPAAVLSKISGLKSELTSPDTHARTHMEFFEKTVNKIYFEYQKKLKQNNALDFDDLLLATIRIFQERPEILEKYRDKFKYILVDEYQDTNTAQYMLIKLLSQKYKNLMVIGDSDQSIYAWRNADFRNILNFEKDFPGAKTIKLEQNYRSTKTILAASQALIKNNLERHEKNLWTGADKGEKIVIQELPNERKESDFVVLKIKKYLNRGYLLGDFAVFYRTHAQSRIIEEALLKAGLPYQIISGVNFYERKEIKDILAYFRIILNPFDALSMERIYNVPARGIGAATYKKVMGKYDGRLPIPEYLSLSLAQREVATKAVSRVSALVALLNNFNQAAEKLSLSQLAKYIIKAVNYEAYICDKTVEGESRWENVKELFSVIKKYDDLKGEAALEKFLEEVALIQNADYMKEKDQSVKLMTLHAAKGLEFPVVFITGMEEKIFPHSRSVFSGAELEEERRLCYVGITRAKKLLFLTYCVKRLLYGTSQYNLPSRFIFEIPEYLTNHSVLSPYRYGADSEKDHENKVINY